MTFTKVMMDKLRASRGTIVVIAIIGITAYQGFQVMMKDMESRTQQELIRMRYEQERQGQPPKKGAESTKLAIQKMLSDLPNKTMRQKLEDAVDAAHKTHGIGFRNSPLDPVDVPMSTSFTGFGEGETSGSFEPQPIEDDDSKAS